VKLVGTARASVAICPLTEHNLGRGRAGGELIAAGAGIALGQRQPLQIDLLRRRDCSSIACARNGSSAPSWRPRSRKRLPCGDVTGARRLGATGGALEVGRPADFFTVNLFDPSIAGAEPDALLGEHRVSRSSGAQSATCGSARGNGSANGRLSTKAPSSVIRGSAEAALAGLTARWSDAESAVPEGRPPCRPFGDDLVDRNGAVPRWCAPRVPEPEHARASDRYGKIRARRGVDRIGRVGFPLGECRLHSFVLRPPEWVHVTASQANRPVGLRAKPCSTTRLRCVARGFSRVVFVIRRDFEQLFATRSGRATPAG